MTSYAAAKGKMTAAPVVAEKARPAAGPLTDAERARITRNKALHEQCLPERLPFFKDLYEAGLIDGWRNVASVRLIEGNGDGTQ